MCTWAAPLFDQLVRDDYVAAENLDAVHLMQLEKAYKVRSISVTSFGMLGSDAGQRADPERSQRDVILFFAAMGILITGVFTVLIGQAPERMDLVVIFSCTMVTLITGLGIWGDVQGGRVPMSSWYGFHPVLMVSSFMGIMVLARWAYMTESPLGPKPTRRRIHGILMCVALVLGSVGYYSIFRSDEDARQPSNTMKHDWEPWRRTAHVYTGYSAIILAVAQAFMGITKYCLLQLGEKMFEYHSALGKVIIFLGGANILLATSFQTWGSGISLLMGLLTGVCTFIGVLLPSAVLTK